MADQPFGSETVRQSRAGGVERIFTFFRDIDGKPWLDIKTNDGNSESLCFTDTEFAAFTAAALKVNNS